MGASTVDSHTVKQSVPEARETFFVSFACTAVCSGTAIGGDSHLNHKPRRHTAHHLEQCRPESNTVGGLCVVVVLVPHSLYCEHLAVQTDFYCNFACSPPAARPHAKPTPGQSPLVVGCLTSDLCGTAIFASTHFVVCSVCEFDFDHFRREKVETFKLCAQSDRCGASVSVSPCNVQVRLPLRGPSAGVTDITCEERASDCSSRQAGLTVYGGPTMPDTSSTDI